VLFILNFFTSVRWFVERVVKALLTRRSSGTALKRGPLTSRWALR
jgi:hypothetical protein